jgi:hypothetical protein
MSSAELEPESDCAGDAQQQLYITDQSSRQRERSTLRNPQLSDRKQKSCLSSRLETHKKGKFRCYKPQTSNGSET